MVLRRSYRALRAFWSLSDPNNAPPRDPRAEELRIATAMVSVGAGIAQVGRLFLLEGASARLRALHELLESNQLLARDVPEPSSCEVCLRWVAPYMLTDEAWNKVIDGVPIRFLCLNCADTMMQANEGRPLAMSDFPSDLPVNGSIVKGFAMGAALGDGECPLGGEQSLRFVVRFDGPDQWHLESVPYLGTGAEVPGELISDVLRYVAHRIRENLLAGKGLGAPDAAPHACRRSLPVAYQL